MSLPTSVTPTATPFTGTVKITNPPASGYRLLLEFGDGRQTEDEAMWLGDDCTVEDGKAAEWEFRHAYRLAGPWTIRATLTLSCGLGSANPTFAGAAPMVAAPGASRANGPFGPDAFLVPEPPTPVFFAPRTATAGGVRALDERVEPIMVPAEMTSRGKFVFSAGDYDGYLTRYVIRWGDGSKDKVVTFDRAKCQEPIAKQHWPETSVHGTIRHAFKRGRYTTSITVTTSGCDGSAVQTRTFRVRHRAT